MYEMYKLTFPGMESQLKNSLRFSDFPNTQSMCMENISAHIPTVQ